MPNTLDPREFSRLYINGQYTESQSARTSTVKNPKDNTLVAAGIPIAKRERRQPGGPVRRGCISGSMEQVHGFAKVGLLAEFGNIA